MRDLKASFPLLKEYMKKELLDPLDYHFAVTMGAEDEDKALLLALLMHSHREGHLCFDLSQGSQVSWAENVEAHSLDSNLSWALYENSLYFQKNWRCESLILQALLRVKNFPLPLPLEPYENTLNSEQKKAYLMALKTSFSVLIGGPGCGKTYTAKQIARHFKKITLCAPTGKAAAHLYSSISDLVGEHEIHYGTLHHLLKDSYLMENSELIIVDECSMIDARMFTLLLERLSSKTRVVLMGDCDQLSPVEQGSIFADIVEIARQGAFPLTALSRNVRCENPEILDLADACNRGDEHEVFSILQEKNSEVLNFVDMEKYTIREIYQILLEEMEKHFCFTDQQNIENLLEEMNRFRILSCLRKGPFGVDAMNRFFYQHYRSKNKDLIIPILITRNAPKLGLYNGEIGLLVHKEQGSTAYFSSNELREIPEALLPTYEYAYCLSVHKSQGSEYNRVALVIPQGSEVFGREVLYTAVTRAKESVLAIGDQQKIGESIQRKSRRKSNLPKRFLKQI